MRIITTILILVIVSFSANAQKVKYKDLFFLLDTDNEQAEPLLRQYLKDPKKAQEANPNLQMAFIFHKKADATDIITSSEEYVSLVDSAILFYDKSKLYLDEKEVSKKNKDFYQAYQRRDVRTGKFGIKLADVVFDIDNKIEALKERKAQVQELKIYYDKSNSNYAAAQSEFKKIKDEYPTQKVLYLRSNDGLFSRVEEIEKKARLAYENVNAFETTIKQIEKAGYHPAIHQREILDYEKDGESELDLTRDNVDFWDYAKWAMSFKTGVKQTIVPMRTELVEFDQTLNQLLDRIKSDSMSLADRLPPANSILSKVREYDSDPLPEYIFKYKMKNIENESYKMSHLYYRDSSDLDFQLEVANTKSNYITDMDSLINLLISRNLNEDLLNYSNYIKSQYNDVAGLEAYIKKELDATIYHKKNSEKEIEALNERAKWLIGETDSIPLFMEVNVGLSKYVPLKLEDSYTTGLYFSGESPAVGYFAAIDNSREQKLKANFKIDNSNFKKQNLELINTMVTEEGDGHYYIVMFYIQLPEQEQFAASIAKIYTSDGLAWETNITLATTPSELLINNNTGDIVIEYDMENYLGEAEIKDRLLLTKKGAVKQ